MSIPRQIIRNLIAVLAMCLAIAAAAATMQAPPAAAAPETTGDKGLTGQASHAFNAAEASGDAKITFEEYRALFNDLKSSELPRTQKTVDGTTHVTFSIKDFELTLADIRSESEFETNLGGGWDSGVHTSRLTRSIRARCSPVQALV